MARKHEDDGAPDADDRIDRLYAQPLSEFVAARNALAGELKRTEPGASARVKTLTRPTITAWAINQVYWHARADYDRLIAAGDELRRLQQQVLFGRGADTREATDERNLAIRRVTDRAARFLDEAGHPASDTVRQRLSVTADAIAAFGSHPAGFTHGRLERELDPPGFEALASLGAPALRLVKSARPAPEPPPARPATPPAGRKETKAERDRRTHEAEREARETRKARERELKDAKGELHARQEHAGRAARAVKEREAHLRELRAARERLERDLERARKAEDEAQREVDRVQADARSAEAARAEAADAEKRARTALDALAK